MRRSWLLVPVLALLGCGAHSSLDLGGSGAGTTTASATATTTATATPAYLQAGCAPTDGPALVLIIAGSSDCSNVISSGITFSIWGQDLAALAPGATLTVGAAPNAPTTASRLTTSGGATMLTTASGGTLTFTTYATGQGGSGTYDLVFEDGTSAQGSFEAPWCPGGGQCG